MSDRHGLMRLCIVVGLSAPIVATCPGCGGKPDQDRSAKPDSRDRDAERAAEDGIDVSRLLGRYRVSGYRRYRGGLTPESWAKNQVGTYCLINEDVCKFVEITIARPRYEVTTFWSLPEGEHATGRRRHLSVFWGFEGFHGEAGEPRNPVTTLDVYDPEMESGEPREWFEVIGDGTLWAVFDGWIFELVRAP